MKKRIDVLMAEKNIVRSRSAAADLIKRGKVSVNSKKISKASEQIEEGSEIIINQEFAFVSRAGEKLQRALDTFGVDPKNQIVFDFGSSTGGFTDCLLQKGARKVYAIDVGTDQLAQKIKNDPRVVSLEKTDVRNFKAPENANIIVIDVSFISLTHVLPVAQNELTRGGSIIALVKPQFEVGKENLNRGGIVTDENKRQQALNSICDFAATIGLKTVATMTSPIIGGSGNIEYLAHFKKLT